MEADRTCGMDAPASDQMMPARLSGLGRWPSLLSTRPEHQSTIEVAMNRRATREKQKKQ